MKVTVSLGTEEVKFEGGTSAGNWRIEALSGATVAFEHEGPEPTVDWEMPEDNSYTLRGWRLDVDHKPLGDIASMDYVVGSDLAVIWVASGITAKASPNVVTPA